MSSKNSSKIRLLEDIVRLQDEIAERNAQLTAKRLQLAQLSRHRASAAESDDFNIARSPEAPIDEATGRGPNLQERVLELLERTHAAMSAPEIASQLGNAHIDSIRSALSKLLSGGSVSRPAVGIYRAMGGGHSGAASGDADD